MPVGVGVKSLGLYERCLSSTTASTVGSRESEAKAPAEATRGGDEKSGGSNQSSDAGKPVRGGVIFSAISPSCCLEFPLWRDYSSMLL